MTNNLYNCLKDSENIWVCTTCAPESSLVNFIEHNGQPQKCSYCVQLKQSVSLKTLGDMVHQVLEDHFQQSPEDPPWSTGGIPIGEIISEISKTDERISEDIRAYLSDEYCGYSHIRHGGEDFYDSECLYKESAPDISEYNSAWQEFSNQVVKKSRFFSQSLAAMLNDLFP